MIRASIYGRLGQDPTARQTANGKPMATASLAVDTARHGEEPATVWFGVIAFGRTAEQLLGHRKGDLLAAMGELHTRRFTGRDGEEREQWSLTAEALISSRMTRPGGGRQRQRSGGQTAVDAGAPFDDDMSHVGRGG